MLSSSQRVAKEQNLDIAPDDPYFGASTDPYFGYEATDLDVDEDISCNR